MYNGAYNTKVLFVLLRWLMLYDYIYFKTNTKQHFVLTNASLIGWCSGCVFEYCKNKCPMVFPFMGADLMQEHFGVGAGASLFFSCSFVFSSWVSGVSCWFFCSRILFLVLLGFLVVTKIPGGNGPRQGILWLHEGADAADSTTWPTNAVSDSRWQSLT